MNGRTGTANSRNIPDSVSVLLDVSRAFLALAVAGAHWTQSYFQQDWPDLTIFGVAAVGGFFVLSGYTIRMVYPDGNAFDETRYYVDRLSRLWSVVLPALLATICLDAVSRYAAPDFYMSHWGGETDHPLFRLAANAGFFGQVWGYSIYPFSNSPFWSLGYEAAFYLMYGLYLSRRYGLLALTALLLGPNILFMLVIWVGGAALYDVYSRAERRVGTGIRVAVAAVAVAVIALAAIDLNGFAGTIRHVIEVFFGTLHVDPARVSVSLVLPSIAVLAAFALIFWALDGLGPRLRVPGALRALARKAGDATFPIYLFHFPIFICVAALGLYDEHSALQKVAVFLCVIGVTVLITPWTNALKDILRRYLRTGAGYVRLKFA